MAGLEKVPSVAAPFKVFGGPLSDGRDGKAKEIDGDNSDRSHRETGQNRYIGKR